MGLRKPPTLIVSWYSHVISFVGQQKSVQTFYNSFYKLSYNTNVSTEKECKVLNVHVLLATKFIDF